MKNATPKDVLSRLAELVGAIGLGTGLGFAAWLVAGPVASATAAALGLIIGYATVRSVGRAPEFEFAFFPMELTFADEAASDEAGVQQNAADDELLLDDPLVADEHSRVVRLFAADESHPAALVARIEDYLDRIPSRRQVEQELRRDEPVPDASASLHAALANIRASLR